MRFFSNPDNRFEKYYTLAQLARRVGISEGRARALWAEADRLPKPDAKDADDHPLWQASSIDRWCKQTGRPVRDPDNNRGLSTWQDAAQPAPIVFSREVVLRERSALPARVYLVAWDTPQGHLVLVTNFAGYRIPERRAAEAAAQILEPVFWEQAIVMISQDVPLGCKDDVFIRPMNMYRIERESGQLDPENVEIKYIGVCWRDDAARVIGQPIPIWLEGTCLPENIQKFKTIGQAKTFLVPDTTTTW
ncbi:MAG: hypothetical protein ACREN8_11285, partial [Candidatus Dormibacteraceae bacterium]